MFVLVLIIHLMLVFDDDDDVVYVNDIRLLPVTSILVIMEGSVPLRLQRVQILDSSHRFLHLQRSMSSVSSKHPTEKLSTVA